MAVSLLFLTFTFIMLFIIDYLFANRFSSKFNYVLIIDSKAHIISISSFMITYTSYMYYFMLFVFLLAWSISLIARKTVNTFIGYVILTIIFIILFVFKINIMPYIGLALAFEFVDYNYIYLTRLSIIIPIIVLSLSVLKFEKSDLQLRCVVDGMSATLFLY